MAPPASTTAPSPVQKYLRYAIYGIPLVVILAIILGYYALCAPTKPSFYLISCKTSSFSFHDNTLKTSFKVTLNTINPNKNKDLIYNPFKASIQSKSSLKLSNGTIQSFAVDSSNSRKIVLKLGPTKQHLDDDSFDKLREDFKNEDGVELNLKLESKLRVKFGKIRVGVSCKGIRVGSHSSHDDSPSKCDVHLNYWSFKF